MLNAIFPIIVVGSAIWVYLDATKNKIGKVPGATGLFNMSAGAWAVVTLGLWLVGLPAYLMKRASLIERAGESPIPVSGRGLKTAALSIIGCLWMLALLGGAAKPQLPSCESSETVTLLEQMINDMQAVKAAGSQFVSLKDIAEQGYNEQSALRSCRARLVTTAGENALTYSVKWNDKDKGVFYVEAQIQ